MKLFFSPPQIFSMKSSLGSQGVRELKPTTEHSQDDGLQDHVPAVLALRCQGLGRSFPLFLLPSLPKILTQEKLYSHSQTAGEIKGETAIIKEGGEGEREKYFRGRREREPWSLLQRQGKRQSHQDTGGRPCGVPRAVPRGCTWSSPGRLRRGSRK